MSKTFRLAATQIRFPWSDKASPVNPYSETFDPSAVPAHIERNVRLQMSLFEKAGRLGADLVVGAEDMQCLGHYSAFLDDRSVFLRLVQEIPGALSKRVAATAKKHRMYVVACWPEKAGRRFYNTSVLFSRSGRIIGKYRKVQLPAGERWTFTPGDELTVFRTDLGNVAVATCYDMMFPEVVRALALGGADVICHPTQGFGWTEEIGEFTVRSRAVDNSVTIVVAHDRRSQVLDCWGNVLADGRGRGNGVVWADVDTFSRMEQPPTHFDAAHSGVASVRERWTLERRSGLFKVISSANPPLMKRYLKRKRPKTRKEIRRLYEIIREEHRRVAAGKPPRYTWG